MENLIVDVKLWGRFVGSLVWDTFRNMAVFEYDGQFRRNGLELAPLTMPLSQGARPFSFPSNRTDCFKGLPGLIADALPDKFGNQIITEWFTRQGLPVGEKMGIRRSDEIIEEVADAVSRWHTIAKDCGVRERHVAEIEKNLQLY